jgi:hypothetical protein
MRPHWVSREVRGRRFDGMMSHSVRLCLRLCGQLVTPGHGPDPSSVHNCAANQSCADKGQPQSPAHSARPCVVMHTRLVHFYDSRVARRPLQLGPHTCAYYDTGAHVLQLQKLLWGRVTADYGTGAHVLQQESVCLGCQLGALKEGTIRLWLE